MTLIEAACRPGQRYPVEEDPTLVFRHEVAATPDPDGIDSGGDLGDVPVDRVKAQSQRDRDPMVPVADEMQFADPVQVHRRDELAAPLGQRQLNPALPVDFRSRVEPAIEIACAVNTADNRGETNALQPEPAFPGSSERCDDIVEQQHLGGIGRLPLQLDDHLAEYLPASGPLEIVLRVGLEVPRIRHGPKARALGDRRRSPLQSRLSGDPAWIGRRGGCGRAPTSVAATLRPPCAGTRSHGAAGPHRHRSAAAGRGSNRMSTPRPSRRRSLRAARTTRRALRACSASDHWLGPAR